MNGWETRRWTARLYGEQNSRENTPSLDCFPLAARLLLPGHPTAPGADRPKNSIGKGGSPVTEDLPGPDSLAAWIALYQRRAVVGVRTPLVAAKIALHLGRFQGYFEQTYGHDQLAACVRRDVLGWQAALCAVPLAPATVNNHLASLSGFATWVTTQAPTLFAAGHPCRGIGELGLGPLEPRALTPEQVRSLKSVCDRLSRFHQLGVQHQLDKNQR